jgi:hypothetical protein
MSFGFSIGDLVALIALTKKTYDGWRDAPREYEDVVQTLSESNMLLSHVERRFDTLTGSETNARKQEEIGELLRSCESTISELRSVIKRRRRLGHWDRLRLGAGASHVNDCKNRLARHLNILTPFLFSLELESIGKDIGSLPATLDRLPQMLSNALPAALGKMIDQRIDDSRTARGSIMTMYGDDDDRQAYRELRRNLRFFGIKDSVVRQERSKLVEFIKTLTHESHDTVSDTVHGNHQSSEEQTVPSSARPVLVSHAVHAAKDTEPPCAKDASTAPRSRYQAYAETEDEEEYTENGVTVPSNADTAMRPEKVEMHTEDAEHRTHIGGNTEDEAKDETEGAKSTDTTLSRRESTTDAAGRRNHQAYVESEDESEDDDLNRTASDEFLAPPLGSRSSQQTRAGSVQRERFLSSDLDQDIPRAKPDVKSQDSDSESNASESGCTPPQGFSGVFCPSDGDTKDNRSSRESGRPFAPPRRRSTSAVCGDLEYQECLGSDSESESIHAVAGTHVSCDSHCSLYDRRQNPEGDDDSWEHLSGDGERQSDLEQRSEVDDHVSKVAHSGGTDDEDGCSNQKYIWRPKPSRRDTSTNRPQRDGHLDSSSSYCSSASSSSFAPEARKRARPGLESPQRLIEYQPLDAEDEGLLTIQLHMPAGYAIHVEGGRVAQFQDRLMPPTCRQYFPVLPPYEEYEKYHASCLHGFPSARQPGYPKRCSCQVVYWTPKLQAWNPNFVDGLRKWVMDEGVRKTSWDGIL